MYDFFQNLLTASFHGSIVIAVVLLLRILLKKAPKRAICLLWMIAFIRLLMPFQLESKLSLQPEAIPLEDAPFYEAVFESNTNEEQLAADLIINNTTPISPALPDDFEGSLGGEAHYEEQPAPEAPTVFSWMQLIPIIWAIGAAALLLYAFISYLHLKLTVREAVKVIGGWECDRIETAFILGYIRPRIYVPMGLTRRTRKHILSHEWAHLKSGDHWFKLLAYLALCLHWFNPLAWVAYRLMCKDMEHACDEQVIRYMDLNERKQYSHALLTCSTNRSHYTPCPVAFGEVSVKSRILSVLNYRKPSFWITLVAVVAIICVCVFLMTSPDRADNSENNTLRQQIQVLEEQLQNDPYYHGVEWDKLKEMLNVESTASTSFSEVTNTVPVSNVEQLLDAIAPNTHIILEPGTYNLWEASNYGKTDGAYYKWGYDNQLELRGLENLIITGSGAEETVILAQPSEADVLYFTDCHNIYLGDFTLGHLERPYPYHCTGYALSLDKSTNVQMEGMGLYGCGVIGLYTQLCSNIAIRYSDIYDCSRAGISFENTYYASVELCRIHEIGIPQSVAYSPIILNDTNEITISGCDIESSYVHYLLSCRNAYETELTGNRFMHNTVSDAAFDLTSGRPVAADNQFRNNDLLAWYEGTNRLVDTLGVEITAEVLDSIHATTPKNTGTRNEVHVSTADELLAAIGPDTEIVLDAETYDLSKTSNYGKTNGNYYFWQQTYDGYELVIYKVNNMTIRSSDDNMKKHTVSTAPRYANVMHFNMCSNITLSGFTAGHTEAPGDCGGGVIRLTGSKNVLVNNCGLFGCGTIGVDIWSSENVFVTECDIYECSVGGVCVYETDTVTIQNTSFRDLGGYNNGYPGYVVAVMSSSNVTLDGKEVTDRINYSSGKLDASQIGLTINGERTDIFEAEVGSFLRIEAAGAPEDTGITWSYDDPYVINGISQKGYYQVEVTGVGNCLVTALIGDVRMVVLIVGTAPEPSPATKNDYCITYAGTPLVECTAAVGDTIALDTTNFPKDSAPVTIWSTDNKENIRLEYTGDTSCEIKILETGEAIVSAYCGGEVAILKIYCRESW